MLCVITGLALACSGSSGSPSAPAARAQEVELASTPAPTVTALPTATSTPVPEPTATPAPRIAVPAGEIVRGNSERAEMALTFDCGASGVPTPAILDALRAAGVRSTFFITGEWATKYPDLTRLIGAEHEVANHSWSHPDFARLAPAQILREMERAEETLSALTGRSTKPLWRAPFGSRDNVILRTLRDAGWPYHIFWTADSGDWLEISPAMVRANVSKAARNGAIIVEHCGSTQTAAVLPQIISDLKEKGFKLVTVTELLRE
jgi:peptidoglycan/xylan/chitin deacetylase (PgdA/CDA1 family)